MKSFEIFTYSKEYFKNFCKKSLFLKAQSFCSIDGKVILNQNGNFQFAYTKSEFNRSTKFICSFNEIEGIT